MAKLNKVIIAGKINEKPDIKYLPNGVTVANFMIGVLANRRDAVGGVQSYRQWHICTYWGKENADPIEKLVYPNASVFIIGSLDQVVYEFNGKKIYQSKIVCDEVVPLFNKKDKTNQDRDYE